MESRGSKLNISDILAGRYRIISLLGQGGMGTVYLAQDLKLLGKQWAIKETVIENQDYQRFIDEAEILVRLNHSYLPTVIDYIRPDEYGTSYLVMDYIKGHTLQQIFERKNKRMESQTVIKYALQICELFDYLHHGQSTPIIYRDLKPSNIMIDENDNIRLIDFGVARNFKEGKQTDTVQLGTIGFAAPEQFEQQQTDNRTDLYTLGAVMYYLLSRGKYYYVTQKRLDEIEEGLSQELTQIINKLLRSSPYDRYQKANDVKRDLTRISHTRSAIRDQNNVNHAVHSKNIGPVIIAVTGVYKGVGTTHTAILIANYLSARQAKVAIVEANDSQDFSRIECMYEGSRTPLDGTNKFTINGVEYYKSGANVDLVSLLLEDYTYIVLDIGCYDGNDWFEEFIRAHKQIVVVSGCEWRQYEIARFHGKYPYKDQSRCVYTVPFAVKQTIDDIRSGVTNAQVVSIPCQPDPFRMNEAVEEVMELIIKEVDEEKSRRQIFKRVFKLCLIASSALAVMILLYAVTIR